MQSYYRAKGNIGSETLIGCIEIGLRYCIEELSVMSESECGYIAKAG